MNKDEAIRLDKILAKFSTKVWMVTAAQDDNDQCELLEAYGYIEIMSHDAGGYFIKLTENGNKFRLTTSFEEQLEEEEKRKENEEFNVELTKKQLSAIKREPYLIAWAIVTTLASFILALLALLK